VWSSPKIDKSPVRKDVFVVRGRQLRLVLGTWHVRAEVVSVVDMYLRKSLRVQIPGELIHGSKEQVDGAALVTQRSEKLSYQENF
jgi:hypothetical protein